jgi:hypothetical protein
VSVHLTLLGFINNEGSVDTFAVMWKDERKEAAEDKGVDEGKRPSENFFGPNPAKRYYCRGCPKSLPPLSSGLIGWLGIRFASIRMK